MEGKDGEAEEFAEGGESLIPRKLKVKMKRPGEEGRIDFLKDYLDYLVRTRKSFPPDFPSFVREVQGADDRGGFIHLRVWSEECDLVGFAKARGYEHRVDQHD